MASRNTTLKLKQNNTGKVLSININQEIVEKPNVPSGLGLHWKHPFSGQWISNTRRIEDTRRIVDISNSYQTQSALAIDTYYRPGPECKKFNIQYSGFGTSVNDSGQLILDSRIRIYRTQLEEYFNSLISIKHPLTNFSENQVVLSFRGTVGKDPITIISRDSNITVFYIAITGECGYTNIIPLDFSKIKQ